MIWLLIQGRIIVQKFSRASCVAMVGFMSVLAVNIVSADVLGSFVPAQIQAQASELAFKRHANLQHVLQKNLQQSSQLLGDTAQDKAQAYLLDASAQETMPKHKHAYPAKLSAQTAEVTAQPVSQAQISNTASTSTNASSKDASAQSMQTASNSSFSQVSSFWQSGGAKKPTANVEKMRIYSEPDQKGKVLANVSAAQNFSVEQGDWVRVKTQEGVVGWALVNDVEQNITNAWNQEYQVVINGQSSNYTVTKISAEERVKRQEAMRKRQMERMKRLSSLWEQDFFAFEDGQGRQDEIQSLKDQVLALNDKIKHLQTEPKEKA